MGPETTLEVVGNLTVPVVYMGLAGMQAAVTNPMGRVAYMGPETTLEVVGNLTVPVVYMGPAGTQVIHVNQTGLAVTIAIRHPWKVNDKATLP